LPIPPAARAAHPLAPLHPAVSRLEQSEQTEGHESKRHRRKQKLPERLRQDRLLLLPHLLMSGLSLLGSKLLLIFIASRKHVPEPRGLY